MLLHGRSLVHEVSAACFSFLLNEFISGPGCLEKGQAASKEWVFPFSPLVLGARSFPTVSFSPTQSMAGAVLLDYAHFEYSSRKGNLGKHARRELVGW